jgi:hypothetical protein
MTSALRSLANTEFWSTPISKSRPVSDLKRVTRKGPKAQSSAPIDNRLPGAQQSIRQNRTDHRDDADNTDFKEEIHKPGFSSVSLFENGPMIAHDYGIFPESV